MSEADAKNRKDWFLVDVKFTHETLADYRAKHEAWEKAGAKDELAPPFPVVAYDIGDFLRQGRENPFCVIERAVDGTSERLAIRMAEFAVLAAKPHILSVTMLAQGERVAVLVDETRRAQEVARAAEWGAKEKADRPQAPRKSNKKKPSPP